MRFNILSHTTLEEATFDACSEFVWQDYSTILDELIAKNPYRPEVWLASHDLFGLEYPFLCMLRKDVDGFLEKLAINGKIERVISARLPEEAIVARAVRNLTTETPLYKKTYANEAPPSSPNAPA